MLVELHCHTRRHSSCSRLEPESAVREAVARGLQGLLLTEHGYWWPDDELAALRAAAGVPEHFVLLAGQEVETELGHVLVIGVTLSLPEQYRVADLRRRFPDAALVRAHPWRGGGSPGDPGLQHPAFAAVEVFNRNQCPAENIAALRAWHRLRFTATAGSDAHLPGQVGTFPTLFDHPVTTVAALAAELHAGRCRPLCKEIARAGSTQTVTELVIGPKGDDEARPRLILKEYRDQRAWSQARATAELTEFVRAQGFDRGRFRVPRVLARHDHDRYLIEESQRGRSLHALIGVVSADTAAEYLRATAHWLARLHALPGDGDAEAGLRRDERRFASYRRAFTGTGNPLAARAEAVLDRLAADAPARYRNGRLVRAHGDFHPQNIILGQDLAADPETLFVSVIDFASAMPAPPALDLGYFLAQFAYQCNARDRFPDALFLDAYAGGGGVLPPPDAINWFRVRAIMSIAAHLIRVGMGESPVIGALLAEAEQLLATG